MSSLDLQRRLDEFAHDLPTRERLLVWEARSKINELEERITRAGAELAI